MGILTTSPRFAATGWTPASLSNLDAWYDASDSASFTYSSGVLVSQWNDLSGNANHMTSPAGKEPSRTGTQNGLAIVEFSPGAGDTDNGDYLNLPNVFSALTQVTVYIVLKTRSDPNADGHNTGLMEFYTAGDHGHHPWTDGSIYSSIGTNVRKSAGNPTDALNVWHTLAVSSESFSYNLRINGASQFSTGINTVGINTAPKFGYQNHARHYKYDGWLAELVIAESGYDAEFETYASTKWAT
jgi:hypothetical protein